MAFHLISELAKRNEISVSAIVFNNGRLYQELKNIGVDVTVIEESKNSFPALIYSVFKILRIKNIDIIHSHRRKENILALIISLLLGKIRLITTLHGMPEFFYKNFSAGALLTKINFFLLSKIFSTIVVSEEIRRKLLNKGFTERKTITIHNGIPIPKMDTPKRVVPEKSFTIGTAGRLVPVKDFDLYIQIAYQLRDYNNIRFLLAGDGPLYQELLQKVEDLNLKNFTLLGRVDDMDQFYTKIDLFMNTSMHEGIPMTILEAMSRGIPVIASHVGGIPEIIKNGVEGFLIQDRDPKKFSELCEMFYSDQNLFTTISNSASQKITNEFTVSVMAKNYLRFYHM
ncbi:MAG: glycosyltransferase [Chitinispirillaceae bacterium]|nr:glycosyltransferase [Chitinispirillaceae bacterium]